MCWTTSILETKSFIISPCLSIHSVIDALCFYVFQLDSISYQPSRKYRQRHGSILDYRNWLHVPRSSGAASRVNKANNIQLRRQESLHGSNYKFLLPARHSSKICSMFGSDLLRNAVSGWTRLVSKLVEMWQGGYLSTAIRHQSMRLRRLQPLQYWNWWVLFLLQGFYQIRGVRSEWRLQHPALSPRSPTIGLGWKPQDLQTVNERGREQRITRWLRTLNNNLCHVLETIKQRDNINFVCHVQCHVNVMCRVSRAMSSQCDVSCVMTMSDFHATSE